MALPQPIQIFRKDLLHLWPETAVTILLFVACAWTAPSGWSHSQYVAVASLLAGFLKYFLMPVSWLVLISRLIHDESLVGDRQFWTSRPYHWASLLAAKLLYLAAFIYLPFLLMQVYLLKHAGLYPTTVIPELLHNLLLLTVIVIVPLTAISAVTGTFARMLLSTVGAIIYVLVLGLGAVYLVFKHMPPPGLDNVFVALIILLPLVAVVFQYATRKTLISRAMLIGTPLVMVILLFITPATALIRHSFPVASGPSVPVLGQIPEGLIPHTAMPGKLVVNGSDVLVGLPLTASGIDEKSSYIVRGIASTVDAGSVHWSTPYLSSLGTQISAANPLVRLPLAMPADTFRNIGETPANIHLSLVATQIKADAPSTWKATLLPFAVPGHGMCSYSSEDPDEAPTCRYPFKSPDYIYLSAPLSASCADASAPKTQGQMRIGSGVTLLDFDPVVTVPLNLSSSDPNPATRGQLCPGAPLTFVEAREAGRTRFEVDQKQVYLPALALRIPERNAAPMSQQPQPE